MSYFQQVGFMVDNLHSGQIPYELISNANILSESDHTINVNIFVDEPSFPCIFHKFARFHPKDAAIFQGILIATSSASAFSMLNCPRAKRIFYVQDLEYLRVRFNEAQWDRVMRDDKIVKVARSTDYIPELIKKGYKVHPKSVENFDIKELLEIANDC